MPVTLFFSALFIIGLHGASIIKILIILTINYIIGKVCHGSRWGPTLTWLFNCLVLFANEKCDGYRYGDLLPALGFLVSPDPDSLYLVFPDFPARTLIQVSTRDGILVLTSQCFD